MSAQRGKVISALAAELRTFFEIGEKCEKTKNLETPQSKFRNRSEANTIKGKIQPAAAHTGQSACQRQHC